MPYGNRREGYVKNDEWYSPKYIFEALNTEFDLDVAAPAGGVEWIPAKRFYTEQDNGLESEWVGRVWMNPPYSAPLEWVNKWIEHNNGFALLPINKSKWWKAIWESDAQCVPMKYNIRFVKPDGKEHSIFPLTMLWAIGETNITILKDSGLGRLR
jgi:phage N-6-adenine-methyltransferase